MAQSAEAATPEALAAIARWAETEVAVPTANSKIYKDECMFSFRNARDDDGVYVNLKSFQCFSREYIPLDRQRDAAKGGQDGGQHLYLHVRWEKVLKDEFKTDADGDSVMDPTAAAAAAADVAAPADADTPMDGAGGDAGAGKDAAGGEVTKLAIGVEGGFQVEGDKYRWDKQYAIVVAPELTLRVTFPCDALPERLATSVTDIIARTDAKQEAAALVWSEGEPPVSKYADTLEQLPTNGKVIPTSGWKCEMSGDTENLWLNLSTGYIGGGRKYFDGTGGSGGALAHFEATGKKYPLVVKLGTITARGADVYSYADDEDKMVTDPHLVKHLEHWGIDAMSMKKTAKTMNELSIELNLKCVCWAGVWDLVVGCRLQLTGCVLQPRMGTTERGLEEARSLGWPWSGRVGEHRQQLLLQLCHPGAC